MKIPIKTHYALKVLVDLALHRAEGLSSVTQIAQRQEIPQQFLQQILLQLKKAGMLRSRRGLHGGYEWVRSPMVVTPREVVQVMQMNLLSLPEDVGTSRDPCDSTLVEMWRRLCVQVEEHLDRITIQDLVNQVKERGGSQDYMI